MNKGANNANIQMAYRKWDLYELPALRNTSSGMWALRITTSLEKPRYLIITFQNSIYCDNRENDATEFTTADISDIRVYLNSTVYPFDKWSLDFENKLYAAAYYTYKNVQSSYYGREMMDPMMNFANYMKNPIFIIDCRHQPEAVKSSTVDVKV